MKDSLGLRTVWLKYAFTDKTEEQKFHFTDLPKLAKETKEAGFTELNIIGHVDWRLPAQLNDELGTEKQLQQAIKDCHGMGVNVSSWISNQVLSNLSLPKDAGKREEWLRMDRGGVTWNIDWTYGPEFIGMIHIADHSTYRACVSYEKWQEAHFKEVEANHKWGIDSIMFDTARAGQYCFNPKHNHNPAAIGSILDGILRKTKEMQRQWDPCSTFGGEHIYALATDYWDYTWTWRPLGHDDMAAWRMAFPQARNASLVADISESNKAFSAGFSIKRIFRFRTGLVEGLSRACKPL